MENIKIGSEVRLMPNTVFLNNSKQATEEQLKLKLYVRDIKDDKYTVARAKTGPILGIVAKDNLKDANENIPEIDPYVVQILEPNTPLYHSSNKNSGILKRLNRFALFTIVNEKNGFGKIKNGAGWVELIKAQKLV